MAKYFVAVLFVFSIIGAFDASAGSSDVYVRGGGGIKGLKWNLRYREARCEACADLAKTYNDTVDAMRDLENWMEDIEEEYSYNSWKDAQKHKQDAPKDTGEGMSEADNQRAADEMNYREMMEEMKAKLPEMEAQWKQLKNLADDLARQLDACEAEKCNANQGKKANKVGNNTDGGMLVSLPFDWRGPYPPVCHKCARLAERLNALPDMARQAISRLEQARAEKIIAEMQIIEARGEHVGFKRQSATDADQRNNDRTAQQTIRNAEQRIEQAEKDITKAQRDIDEIRRNFDQTLKLYNECVPTCPKETGMSDPSRSDDTALALGGDYSKDMKGCTLSYRPESFVIGPNSQYGTGAQMKNKAKDMATGLLGSAIGGLGGGGGFSLGGGGHRGMDDRIGTESTGGGRSGPKTDKDSTRGDFTPLSAGDVALGVRAGFTNDGFIVSQKIEDSPGNASTFHATWLEDGLGRKLLPTRYYIFSLYVDHKLTVWWTYDHWTNGVHDKHDEGRESTSWRTNLGDFRVRFGGEEGAQNSIWYQSGFETAVKGVRTLGAQYPVTPGDLTGCGINLVSHVTLPKQDPVSTIPVLGRLFINPDEAEGRKEKDLIIHITPAIMDAGGPE